MCDSEKPTSPKTDDKPEEITLDSLLAEVTPENLHGEVDMGPPVGKEVW